MGSKIALIACCKSKLDVTGKVPAHQLYTGQLFQAQFAYAQRVLELPVTNIYVLSAGYGLVRSDLMIEKYNETLFDMDSNQRRRWVERVWRRLYPLLVTMEQPTVYMMAGKMYREKLTDPIGRLAECINPVPSMFGYGRQVQWYQEQLRGVK